jgi:hypothetical protein
MAGGGGKDSNYWPGFVDALTNVVIAMVFVIVVLAISLSFSAQLLAKRMAAKVASLEQDVVSRASAVKPDNGDAGSDQPSARLPTRTVIEVRGNEASVKAVSGSVRAADSFLILEFAPGALTIDSTASDKLASSLSAVKEKLASGGKVQVLARGPSMEISDNQRSAFLRIMAVRNVLIDQGIASERIEPRIDTDTKASSVTVSISVEGGRR